MNVKDLIEQVLEGDLYTEAKNTRVRAKTTEEAWELATQAVSNAQTELNWAIGHLLTVDRESKNLGGSYDMVLKITKLNTSLSDIARKFLV